jgi:hypothetical protein
LDQPHQARAAVSDTPADTDTRPPVHIHELDVSSCGSIRQKALANLKEAVRLFLDEAGKMGTLDQILEEAGFLKRGSRLEGPKFIGTQWVSLPLRPVHSKA